MNYTGFDMGTIQGLRRNHEREGYGASDRHWVDPGYFEQAKNMERRLDSSLNRSPWWGTRIILEEPVPTNPRKFTIDFTDLTGEKILARNLLRIVRDLIRDPSKQERIPRLIEWCLDLG